MAPQKYFNATTKKNLCHHKNFNVTRMSIFMSLQKCSYVTTKKYFLCHCKIFLYHHKNMLNEDTGHIVCWATTVKHKNIAQQRNLFLLIIVVFLQKLLHLALSSPLSLQNRICDILHHPPLHDGISQQKNLLLLINIVVVQRSNPNTLHPPT